MFAWQARGGWGWRRRASSGRAAHAPALPPFTPQFWTPGRADTSMLDPAPVCAAPGARANVSVKLVKDFGGALGADDWYMDGVWLTLSRVPAGLPNDHVLTQTFGRCPETPLLAGPAKFVFGQTRYFPLCADAPWWKWKLSVRTAADVGAGTDADIRLMGLACGAFVGLGTPCR